MRELGYGGVLRIAGRTRMSFAVLWGLLLAASAAGCRSKTRGERSKFPSCR